MLVTKEELVTDLNNLVYHHTDEVEKLSKMKDDADVQLLQCMQQIKDLAAERDFQAKELTEFKTVAQAVVDMVDPIEEEGAEVKSLVERLREGPQKIVGYLFEMSK